MSQGTITRSSAEGTDSRQIEGTAIVFSRESELLYSDDQLEIREVIAPEAVTRELLDSSTILLTLYHNNERILGRSVRGSGSMSYEIRDDGVHFRCSMPNTPDGDTALELVDRADITGCSFAFRTNYGDTDFVTRSEEKQGKKHLSAFLAKKRGRGHFH